MAIKRKPLAELVQQWDAGDCIKINIAYLGKDTSRASGVSKLVTERFLKIQPAPTDSAGNPIAGAKKNVTFVKAKDAPKACPEESTHPVPLEVFSGFHAAEISRIMAVMLGSQILAPPPVLRPVPTPIPAKEEEQIVRL